MMDVGSGQTDDRERMLSSELTLSLVLVTYGARIHLVDQAVRQALLHRSVKSIIIVDNDSATPIDRSNFDPLIRDRIHVLRQKTNTGSAGGYNIGLSYARNLPQNNYIILLDDDLLIEEQTVTALLQYIQDNSGCEAMIIPRDDRSDQLASLAAGHAPTIRTNSFHDFHVLNWRRLLHRHRPIGSRSRAALRAVPVDYAPYAGMVLSLALVRRAELPDTEMYVYCDDYDYLMKLKIAGAWPVLIDAPPLKSIDQSWNQKSGRAPALFNTAAPVFRVYYSLRNRVAYERRFFVNNYLIYIVNMVAFLVAGSLVSLLENGVSVRRLRLIATAIRDGWRGNLGRNDEAVRRYT
jgi:GT2 family glycosyltransferase